MEFLLSLLSDVDTNLLYLVTSLAIFLSFISLILLRKFNKRCTNFRSVPVVKGGLPFVGHGLSFSKDVIGFVRGCYQKYGNVFRIQIFNRSIVVVCDRSLVSEYFSKKEDDMSLYHVLDQLFFGQAFTDNSADLPLIITIVKRTVGVNFEQMVPKIVEQAGRLVHRIKQNSAGTTKVNITSEAIRFVSSTSAKCFIGIDMTPEFYQVLQKFTHLLNKIVVLTYFFPQWLLRLVMAPFLRRLRRQMTNMLLPEIQSYRDDPDKCDSNVIRKAVEYNENGRTLSNEDIGNILVCLLYVSSENTALGLSASLIDLAKQSHYWDQVKERASHYFRTDDYRGLLTDPVITACVMESARMTSHVFALMRKPLKCKMLGDYYIGECDCLALCEPMFMKYNCSGDTFEKGDVYNPSRFLTKTPPEKMDAQSVMTWGAKVHLCPGKMFALYEIKLALAFITTNFHRFDISDEEYLKLDYFSPSAFAERNANVIFRPLHSKGNILHYKEGGWLLRQFLNDSVQEKIYKHIVDLSQGSEEQYELLRAEQDERLPKYYPLTFYNLVYTNTSNCAKPVKLFQLADKVIEALTNDPTFPFPTGVLAKFDSLYAQLFSAGGSMAVHKDQYINWGVSINLGSAAEFQFGSEVITLQSGDIFVADFSKVDHGVRRIIPNTSPKWFAPENVETFGCQRCSIQIRNVSECDPFRKILSINEFKEMVLSKQQ